MGFFDFLLGTSPSVETPQAQVQPKSTLTKEQSDALSNLLLPYLTSGASGGVAGYTPPAFNPPGGQFIPGVTQGEQTSLDALEQTALAFAPGGTTYQALQDAINQGPADFEQYFQKSVTDPLLKQFHEVVQPDIGRRFAGSYFGGERVKADEFAYRNLLDTLASARSSTALSEYDAAANRRIQALGLAPSFTQPLETNLTAQALPRAIATQETAARYQEFQRQQQEVQQRYQNFLNALGLKAVENIATAPVVQPGSTGFLTSVASAFAGGVGSNTKL